MLKLTYEHHFVQALENAALWGVNTPVFHSSHKRSINENSLTALSKKLQTIMGHIEPENVSQQCFAINFLLKEYLEETLNIPLFYTLGYVTFHDRNIFYTPEAELKTMMGGPLRASGINLHAWLTTPAFEIIDPTFSTTYGVVNNEPDCIGCVMAKHYSEFTKEIIHIPQVVGEDFITKIGGVVELSLLC